MVQFRYTLDKGSKKFICPNCNQKRFVKYIDNNTNQYLSDEFGKCDRNTSCSYHYAPPTGKKAYLIPFILLNKITNKAYTLTDKNGIKTVIPSSQILEINTNDCWVTEWFLSEGKDCKIHYLSNEYKYFNTENLPFINQVFKDPKPLPKPSFHNFDLLQKYCIDEVKTDNLTLYLNSIFAPDEVLKLKQKYLFTGSNLFWKNETMYWQIDNKDKIHACKLMLYDNKTGKRIKEPYPHINWLHNALKEPEFNLNQCLFGLHLINEDYQKTIALVESEKTAIIMSFYLPEFIWLATGSKQNLKAELLKPIKRRKIVLFPDIGEFENWNNKAIELQMQGFNIATSEILEKSSYPKGYDLADIYLKTEHKN